MKLLVTSDLHLDVYEPQQVVKIVETLYNAAQNVDYVIIAGDLSTYGLTYKNINLWNDVLHPILDKIIFVPGNHDYWHSNIESFSVYRKNLKFAHILDNETITINNKIIYGGTLWFPNRPEKMKGYLWADFRYINYFENIFRKNKEFFENAPDAADLIITHHLPSKKSIGERFKGAITNIYFYTNIEDLIKKLKPKYVVHGHTHDKFNYMLNSVTRVIANPLGYPGENGPFENMIIEL